MLGYARASLVGLLAVMGCNGAAVRGDGAIATDSAGPDAGVDAAAVDAANVDDAPTAADAMGDEGGTSPVPWRTTSLDFGTPPCGSAVALAHGVGGERALHVAFTRPLAQGGPSGALSYANNAGGSWTVTEINANYTAPVSLLVDRSGTPHLLFGYDVTYPPVRYATQSGGAWQTTVVTGGGPPGYSATFVLEGAQVPHIARVADQAGESGVVHEVLSGDGVWTREVIASSGPNRFSPVAIQISSDGALHLAWSQRTRIVYATKSSSGWQMEPASPDVSGASLTVVGLRVSDRVQLVYYDSDDAMPALLYAIRDGSQWREEHIPLPGVQAQYGFPPAMELAPSGELHLAVHSRADQAILHVWGNAGDWSSEIVSRATDLRSLAMSIDGRGGLHILSCDSEGLHYTTNTQD